MCEDLITLTQNWDNKLRTVKSGATTIIALKYDPDGSRIRKDSSTTVRKYIVDIVADLPVVLMEPVSFLLNKYNFFTSVIPCLTRNPD